MIISFLVDDLRNLHTDNSVDFKKKLDVVKTTLVEILLNIRNNYCPDGSQIIEGVDTIPFDHMLESCYNMLSSCRSVETVAMGHHYDSLYWNVSMLKFWTRYWAVMNDLADIYDIDHNVSDGDVQRVLDAILSMIYPPPGVDGDGITVIWSECRSSFIQLYLDLVDDTVVQRMPSHSAGGAVYSALNSKHDELLVAQRVIDAHYPPLSDRRKNSFKERNDSLDQYLSDPAAVGRRETNELLTILENSKLILTHVHKCDEIINLLVNSLLMEYVMLCMSEGSKYSRFADNEQAIDHNEQAINYIEQAINYYKRGTRLSIILATERIGCEYRSRHGLHELQLFNRLSAPHLEYLLKCMNDSSIEVMRLERRLNKFK